MISAWRLVKAKHAAKIFSGEGAPLVSGRWHQQGVSVVYVSESLALSVVERY
jgi:RES domain-containing protein